MRPRLSAFARFAMVSALAAGLAACGRKGPLDLPPADTAAATQQQQQSATGPLKPPIGAGSQAPAPQNPGAPNRPFVLDPILN